jgi:putative membrane protein
MLIEIILAILIGIIGGTFSGMVPGIHVNLISALLISISPLILTLTNPITLAIIIISMAITHTFLDTLPSTYLGAPNEDTALSVLPAHRFLLKGEGHSAIKLATIGSLLGLILTIILTPILIHLSINYYDIIKTYIPYLLIASVIFLLIKERGNKIAATLIILLAGVLGIITLNLPTLKEPLFPLLSGLFGVSTLLISLKDKIKIPLQKTVTKLKLKTSTLFKSLGAVLATCTVAGFLPGISSSQSAIVSSSFFKKLEQEYFILMVGAINTIIMVISFSALYTISKARNGAVIAVSKIIENINLNKLILFLFIALIVGGIATFLTLKISKTFSKQITKLNYRKVCTSIIGVLILLTLILSGWIGLIILITSTSIGILPSSLNVGKNHLMACLIIPIILFFML